MQEPIQGRHTEYLAQEDDILFKNKHITQEIWKWQNSCLLVKARAAIDVV